MLMTITQYQRSYFAEGSRPSRNTVKAWIANDDIYGEKIGGMWYVDPERKVVKTDNELVIRVLCA